MPDYELSEVAAQVGALVGDMPALLAELSEQWRRLDLVSARRVLVAGSGDSLYAAKAARSAFEAAGIVLDVCSPTALLGYGSATRLRAADLLVVVSTSGANQTCVELARTAEGLEIDVVAVTGVRSSALAAGCQRAVYWTLDGMAPSPGIRTYQASFLALATLASREKDLADLDPAALARALASVDVPALVALAVERLGAGAAPSVLALDPDAGTAHYVAAKMIECAGVAASAFDLENWWHVQRFATPSSTPIIALEPTPFSLERFESLITRMRGAGHSPHVLRLPLDLELPELARPLVGARYAAELGLEVARRLNRRPFSLSYGRAQ